LLARSVRDAGIVGQSELLARNGKVGIREHVHLTRSRAKRRRDARE
jgi:hypothetical protein